MKVVIEMTIWKNLLRTKSTIFCCVFGSLTRMHSSRMHTVRCSGRPGGVSQGKSLPRGGVSAQGVSTQKGCLPRRGVYQVGGGVFARGCLPREGGLPRVCLPRRGFCPCGVSAGGGGVCPSACLDTPL